MVDLVLVPLQERFQLQQVYFQHVLDQAQAHRT
jgi:hypothetical protein